jgi:hypothetical protein
MSKKFLLLSFLFSISIQNNFFSKDKVKSIKLEEETDQAAEIANIGKKMEDDMKVETINKEAFLSQLEESERKEFDRLSKEEQDQVLTFASMPAAEQEEFMNQVEASLKQEAMEDDTKEQEVEAKQKNMEEAQAIAV